MPPLYKVQKGKEMYYAFTDEERDAHLKTLGVSIESDAMSENDSENDSEPDDVGEKKSERKSKVSIQRYKGLGEMNYDELRDTTMSKENRVLKRVTIDDAQAADEGLTPLWVLRYCREGNL